MYIEAVFINADRWCIGLLQLPVVDAAQDHVVRYMSSLVPTTQVHTVHSTKTYTCTRNSNEAL